MVKLRGFTLVEVMMVMAVFGIISSVVITVYFQLVRTANRAAISAEVEQNASYAMEIMVRDIRRAGCAEVDGEVLSLKDPECAAVVTTFSTAEEEGVTNLIKTVLRGGDSADHVINNPSKTSVQSLDFSVDASGQSVTIDLVMESAQQAAHSRYKGELSLHETVSLRSY